MPQNCGRDKRWNWSPASPFKSGGKTAFAFTKPMITSTPPHPPSTSNVGIACAATVGIMMNTTEVAIVMRPLKATKHPAKTFQYRVFLMPFYRQIHPSTKVRFLTDQESLAPPDLAYCEACD